VAASAVAGGGAGRGGTAGKVASREHRPAGMFRAEREGGKQRPAARAAPRRSLVVRDGGEGWVWMNG
jgi:hypothetical protein